MRIINLNALRADIDQYFFPFRFNKKNAVEDKIYEWTVKAWGKFFTKENASFVHPVIERKMPSFFKSENSSKTKLIVDHPDGPLDLEPETEWDVKDAQNGTLFYYAPRDKTIYVFADEVLSVRDYLLDLLSQHPDTDLNKRSFRDTKQAADRWHAEQRRILQERLSAEAELRAAQAAAEGRKHFRFQDLSRNSDWWSVGKHFNLNGSSFVLLRLASQRALTYESSIMDHCVHSYGNRILDGSTVILSLRKLDLLETPLITIELATGSSRVPSIVQIKGMSNSNPELTVLGFSEWLRTNLEGFSDHELRPLNLPQLSSSANGDLTFRVRIPPQ